MVTASSAVSQLIIFSDAYILEPNVQADGAKDVALFSVFDGHGGKEVALFCKEYFTAQLLRMESFKNEDFEQALMETFFFIDEMLIDPQYTSVLQAYKEQEKHSNDGGGEEEQAGAQGESAGESGSDEVATIGEAQNREREQLEKDVKSKLEQAEVKGSLSRSEALELMMKMLQLKKIDSNEVCDLPTVAGCTAIVALRVENMLYVANAGDSRAVICQDGNAVALSDDHKPLNTEERTRIEAAGGYVTAVGRINGSLNLSRSIGDLKFKGNKELDPSKQIITAKPDVTTVELSSQHEFLVVACDGVWDIMSNQAIVDFVKKQLSEGITKVSEIIENVFEHCIADDPRIAEGLGGDNMTCIIVFFKPLSELAAAYSESKS